MCVNFEKKNLKLSPLLKYINYYFIINIIFHYNLNFYIIKIIIEIVEFYYINKEANSYN